ncbi:MAG: hypothetical protein ACKVOR_07215 [Flavobacteriales bacterium]
MHVQTYTYGNIPIEMWEYPAYIAMLVVVWFVGAGIKRRRIAHQPEYRFFLWGLWAKVAGGFLFACIYIFHYGQGDTTSFYECSIAFCRLLFDDPSSFFTVLAGDGTQEMKSYFTAETGEPMMYMFGEGATRFTMKLLVPFMLLSGQSYFITTLLISIVTYGALWRLYLMFTSYFPQYTRNLAIAILFMPSVIFWGSGILKDSFTLAATCYLMVITNNIIQRQGRLWLNVAGMLFFGYVIISVKAYVILILLPSSLVWFFYSKVKKIKNRLVRYLIVPFTYIAIIGGSYYGLTAFGETLGKFSIDRALKTAAITQGDLKQEYYEGNSFDIGDFEATPMGALAKFPQATAAGLFRPFLLESRNTVMVLSGIENLFILGLTLVVIVTVKWKVLRKLVSENPVIIYSFVFSVLFAFMIGLTTSNFGALVRFKIPLIPLYMASIMIMFSKLRKPKITNSRRFQTM